MTEHTPTALILPTPGGDAEATLGALRSQSVSPGRVRRIGEGAMFGAALHAAADDDPWVWLLDSGVVPGPSALEALLEARAALESEPPLAILASYVVGTDGAPDRASTPALEGGRARRVVHALSHRTVAMRAARYGALLVHVPSALQAKAAGRSGAPAHDLAWTARLLRDRSGALVPGSVAVRRSGRRSPRSLSGPADLVGAAQLLAGLPRADRLWFLVRVLGGPPRG